MLVQKIPRLGVLHSYGSCSRQGRKVRTHLLSRLISDVLPASLPPLPTWNSA
jgi:hypothetical protein